MVGQASRLSGRARAPFRRGGGQPVGGGERFGKNLPPLRPQNWTGRMPVPLLRRPTRFRIRVCAGEAGCHAGASPAGRIGLFTTESWVREEAVRPNPKARPGLNCPVATTVNLIE